MILRKAAAFIIVAFMLVAGMVITLRTASAAAETNPDSYPLYAGQDIPVGVVKVWNDDTYIHVKYLITLPGWFMTKIHLAYGDDLSEIPQKNGNPIPGKFPIKECYTITSRTTEDEFCIPLNSFEDTDSCKVIAAHADIAHLAVRCGCLNVQVETAWAAQCRPGNHDFPGRNWATYITYCITQTHQEVWSASFAYEDQSFAKSDFDYNDLVVNANIGSHYSQNKLLNMTFSFEAMARGAAYHHAFMIEIPAGTFGSDGIVTTEYFDSAGNSISTSSGVFDKDAIFSQIIFDETWDAITPNGADGYSANTADGSGTLAGRMTVFTIEFDVAEPFDLSIYTPSYVGVHGDYLFFNPVLNVKTTGEAIGQGDARTLVVPNAWQWPQGGAVIWQVYGGITAGAPPTFSPDWYSNVPNANIWTP